MNGLGRIYAVPSPIINKCGWHPGKAKAGVNTDVDELRNQIETIDKEIIDLIATRMEIADELAKEKKHSSQGYWDSKKEREVVGRYMELCEDVSLSEWEAKLIAEVILKISKERQKTLYDSEPPAPAKPGRRK